MLKKFLSKKLFLVVIFMTATLSTPQPLQAGFLSWISSWFNSKTQEPIFPISNASKASAHNQPATSYSSHSSWFSWFTSGSWNPFSWFFVSKKDDHAQTNAQESFNVNDGLEPKGHKTPLPKIEAQSMRQDTHNQEEKSANKRELFQELLKVSKDITSATNKFISNVGQEYQKHLQQNPEKKEASSDTSIIPSPKDFQPQLENIENDAQAQVGNQHHSLQQIPKETTVIQPTSHALVPLVNALRSTPQQQISLELPRTSTTLAARLTPQGILIQTIRENETIESLILIGENLSRNLNIFWQNILNPEEKNGLQILSQQLNNQLKSQLSSASLPHHESEKLLKSSAIEPKKNNNQLLQAIDIKANSDNDSDLSNSIVWVAKNEKQADRALKNHQTFVFNAHRLSEYCYAFAEENNLDHTEYLSHAKQEVNLGGLYAFYILSGQPELVPQSNENEIKSSVEALMWYFYNEHLGKTFEGAGFEEGSFLIPKEFEKFFDKAGYTRISSHVKKLKPGTNKGIDVQNQLFQGKEHILAIALGHEKLQEYIFVKPENHGTSGPINTLFHLWEWVIAQARKIQPVQEFMGMKPDHDPSFKKERISPLVKKAYTQVIKACKLQDEQKHLTATEVGIFEMYAHAQSVLRTLQDESSMEAKLASEGLKQFIGELHKKYDYLHMRIGDEVILPKEPLAISGNCYHLNKQNKNNDPFYAYALALSQAFQLIETYKKQPNKTIFEDIQRKLEFLKNEGANITQDIVDPKLKFLRDYIQDNTLIFEYSLQSEYKLKDLIAQTSFLERTAQLPLVKQIELEQKENSARPKLFEVMRSQIEELCKQGEDELSHIKNEGKNHNYEQLRLKFSFINDESRGLRKVTEWRRIAGDNFSDIQTPVKRLLQKINTSIEQAEKQNKPTDELEKLCDNLQEMWMKTLKTVTHKAHELGFYTHYHQDIKSIVVEKAALLKNISQQHIQNYEQLAQEDLSRLQNDEELKKQYASLIQLIKQDIEKKPLSFEHQIGFSFGSPEPLLHGLELSAKATHQELEQLFPRINSKKPTLAHPLVSKLHKLHEENDYEVVDLSSSMDNNQLERLTNGTNSH
jgi:hypothetical protein